MYYRIMTTPPGYPEDSFLVGMYESLDYASSVGSLISDQGERYPVTIERARDLIPDPKTRLDARVDHQFVELWESAVDVHDRVRSNRRYDDTVNSSSNGPEQ
jgi:hypothetical protein